MIPYAMGYRCYLNNLRITDTGGIYIRTFPSAETLIISSKITEKPRFFTNSVFVQSLLPDEHNVLIKKEGYHDYYKNIIVKEERVTKLEDVILFKNNIQYNLAAKTTESPFETKEEFILEDNNLYYVESPEIFDLSEKQKSTPILEDVVAFTKQNGNLIWLGVDGILYKANIDSLEDSQANISEEIIYASKDNSYKIIADNKNVLINSNSNLKLLDLEEKYFKQVSNNVVDAKISPNGENIVFHNGKEVFMYNVVLAENQIQRINLIYGSDKKIKNCVWLNNHYIILVTGDNIVISEIDYRGNINAITLPHTAVILDNETLKTKTIEIKDPQIYFNRQKDKLYVLTDETLLITEKLTP
jgi:archaellum component FlaF (FlaF/FlaG flagellin family)